MNATQETPPPLKETPSQTAGPFLHIAFAPAQAGLASSGAPQTARLDGAGEAVAVDGRIFDAAGGPVRAAALELYQLDAAGRAIWGRCGAAFEDGCWRFETVRPAEDGPAPYLTFLIFGSDMNRHLHTRAYFPEWEARNAADPALSALAPERRRTLLLRPTGPSAYGFDIRLRGADETVFFDA